jgi:hypothetical protein
MIPDAIETFKDAMLRTFAAQLRAERPGLTHARSFQLAQEQHPDLREEWPEETNPSPMPAYTPPPPGKVASSGYRYDPGAHPAPKSHVDSLRTILKDAGVWPAVQRIAAVENLDPQTAELVHGEPVKVEASEQLFLVHGPGISIW